MERKDTLQENIFTPKSINEGHDVRLPSFRSFAPHDFLLMFYDMSYNQIVTMTLRGLDCVIC